MSHSVLADLPIRQFRAELQTLPDTRIALRHGVSPEAVRYWRHKLGEPPFQRYRHFAAGLDKIHHLLTRGHWYSTLEITHYTGLTRKYVCRALLKLYRAGDLERRGNLKYPEYRLRKEAA